MPSIRAVLPSLDWSDPLTKNVHAPRRDSQLTQLLLANTSQELRTPLNAIINYLEVAKEDALDTEAREIVEKSCFACQSFIRAIGELFVPDEE